VLAAGATAWRDLPVPGRELRGIHQAMEYLPYANQVQEGDLEHSPIDVAGKHVVIIGGGDTGADCLGTAHRQGAASVTQLEIMPRPSDTRAPGNPWPTFAFTYKVTSAHEEGGERIYSVNTERFVDDGNGNVRALLIHEVQMVNGRFEKVEGSDRELPADFVFLAMGFVGPEKGGWLDQLGVALDQRGNIARGDDFQTNVPGVFVAGDMGRGQSLIVWAIAEGRACASNVDRWLMGDTSLPAPIAPTARPLV
jgi:glutamate synthase (NADPH/NADH) small chain